MKNLILILFFTFGINYSYLSAQNFEKIIPKQGKKYKVIKIKDGDTLVLLVDNKELKIRLNHIDCPEKKQPYGTKAKQYVANACFGQKVSLIHRNKYDRYGRLIAEIILKNGQNLNKNLVKNGLAWHYKKHSTNAEYAKLEQTARQNKINIWSEKQPIAPWDWRKMRK